MVPEILEPIVDSNTTFPLRHAEICCEIVPNIVYIENLEGAYYHLPQGRYVPLQTTSNMSAFHPNQRRNLSITMTLLNIRNILVFISRRIAFINTKIKIQMC